MRLTVGPLPPAVYWRRRAVVLGALLLFLIVAVYSCSGPGQSDAAKQVAESPTPPAGTSSPDPTMSVLTPQTGAPPTTEAPAALPATAPAATEQAPAAGSGACTDAEMKVTPVPSLTSAQRGVTITIRLKIKNIGNRTCSRDVGADLQEIFVKQGAQKIWSSDTCGTAKGSDLEPFTPGFEREYQVAWNGKDATKCADGVANGPVPPAGDYQILGRLGTKLSEPVKLTLTA